MPTYEYRCDACSHQFERFQKMSDDPVRECEDCGGEVRRILFPVAVHFKGNGFYTTDYAQKSKPAASRSEARSNGGEKSNGSSSSESSSASEPKVGERTGKTVVAPGP